MVEVISGGQGFGRPPPSDPDSAPRKNRSRRKRQPYLRMRLGQISMPPRNIVRRKAPAAMDPIDRPSLEVRDYFQYPKIARMSVRRPV